MNVLVTGAGGFVGRAVVAELAAAGHSVQALARPRRDGPAPAPAPGIARLHYADIGDAAALAQACAGVGTVVHLVGIISEVGRNTFERIHIEGTRQILAAARAAGVGRFVHMSALGARPDAPARYHRSKWAAEELVRQSGLAWTIFRPSIIYGPGDQFVNLFARLSRWSPILPVMGSGRALLQPIPVGDVARCFARAVTEPRALGQSFDLAGPAALSFVAILRTILAVTHRRRLLLHIPLPLARLQARVLEFLFDRVLHRPPPLNRDQLLMLQEDNVGDPRPAQELFGLLPVPFATGIGRYLASPRQGVGQKNL